MASDRVDVAAGPLSSDGEAVGGGPLQAAGRVLAGNWIIFVLLGMILAFSLLSSSFPTVFNLRNVMSDASLLLIMAVGQTYVMISGGIDLSIGSVLVFSGIVAGKVMGLSSGSGAPGTDRPAVIIVAMLAGILAGGAWGVVNGVLIAFAKVPPLIVTLGTLGMAFGLAQIITGGTDLSGVPAALSKNVGQGVFYGVPVLVIIAAVTAVLGGVYLAWSRFGRFTYAIGSNPEAAKRVAIPVRSHYVKIYVLQGLLSGLAGVLALTRYTTTTITSHGQDNLAVIAGVVLGGTSLFGGYGTILKTVIGIMIPAVLANGLVIVGVQAFWQTTVTGAILIFAVFFDQLRRKARSKGT